MRGYEVFRFGGAVLTDPETAKPSLTEFFTALFDRFAGPADQYELDHRAARPQPPGPIDQHQNCR
ncbi:hypothetical protein ACFC06_10595 [Nocardia sp. NPDC056064]|uniref:hypothetical protein n=1 Tax=Nocardia sp. NPDC056064 TaxID=3345701 RepID=UPI0035D91014